MQAEVNSQIAEISIKFFRGRRKRGPHKWALWKLGNLYFWRISVFIYIEIKCQSL